MEEIRLGIILGMNTFNIKNNLFSRKVNLRINGTTKHHFVHLNNQYGGETLLTLYNSNRRVFNLCVRKTREDIAKRRN
ncbi:hypothetical protein BH23THE1_BH23THE1_00270 [soil metagenome]